MTPRGKDKVRLPYPASRGQRLPAQPSPSEAERETPSLPTSLPAAPAKPTQPAGPWAPGAGGGRLISVGKAATILGLSVASVRRLIWTGKLPVLRLTRRLQVDVRDLERLIEQAKDRIG